MHVVRSADCLHSASNPASSPPSFFLSVGLLFLKLGLPGTKAPEGKVAGTTTTTTLGGTLSTHQP